MNIVTLPVGQLATNCYLIIDRNSRQVLIIDPGDDADYIQRIIADERVNPVGIIATHGHFDHILGAAELQLAYNIPFSVHAKDEFLVKRMGESARYFTGISAGPPPKISTPLTQRQKITLGKANFKVVETPGHTPGSLTLHCETEKIAFVGDLLFSDGGVGRTDFSYSSHKKLESSIKKILKLPPETLLLSGHGPGTTIGNERQFHKLAMKPRPTR